MVRWLVILCLMAGGASADELVLAKIRLDRFAGDVPRTCYPEPDPETECLVLDGVGLDKYRVTLSRVYAGAVPWRSAVVLLPITVQEPAAGHFVYALFKPQKTHPVDPPGVGYQFQFDQDYVVVQGWSDAANGFCLRADDVAVDMAAALETLRRDHPCKGRR